MTTLGGTNVSTGPAFTALTATATSGTPALAGTPSAVPGQTITIRGSGLNATSEVVFEVTTGASFSSAVVSKRSQVVQTLISASADGTSGTVVVPVNAVTGRVRVVGDANLTEAPLQIVPVVTALTVNSVAGDNSTAVVTLTGAGFIEGGADYIFGATAVPDPGITTGPTVTGDGKNSTVRLTVPLGSAGTAFGPVSVRTAGGTSTVFVV